MDASLRYVAAEALGQLGRADGRRSNCLLLLAQDQEVNASVPAALPLKPWVSWGEPMTRLNLLLLLAQDQKVDAYARRAAAKLWASWGGPMTWFCLAC